MKESTKETKRNDLANYFKGNTSGKWFHDFNNAIEPFEKIKSSEKKLEEVKTCRTCLNQT